jgi:uncharacterized Tic20 family protein
MINDILNKLKAPAIGLIIAGVLNFALGLLTVLSGLLRLTGIIQNDKPPTDEAEKIGYFIGTFGGYTVAVLSLIIAPIIVYGAIQMMNGRKYRLAKTSAILAVIPLISCCFIVGIPLGIWALVVLSQPEVKAFFSSEMNYQNYNPPMPPNF